MKINNLFLPQINISPNSQPNWLTTSYKKEPKIVMNSGSKTQFSPIKHLSDVVDYHLRVAQITERPTISCAKKAFFTEIVSSSGLKELCRRFIELHGVENLPEFLKMIEDKTKKIFTTLSSAYTGIKTELDSKNIRILDNNDDFQNLPLKDLDSIRSHLKDQLDKKGKLFAEEGLDALNNLPYLSDKLSFLVCLKDEESELPKYGVASCPMNFPRFITVPASDISSGQETWIPIEIIIKDLLQKTFVDREIESLHPFTVRYSPKLREGLDNRYKPEYLTRRDLVENGNPSIHSRVVSGSKDNTNVKRIVFPTIEGAYPIMLEVDSKIPTIHLDKLKQAFKMENHQIFPVIQPVNMYKFPKIQNDGTESSSSSMATENISPLVQNSIKDIYGALDQINNGEDLFNVINGANNGDGIMLHFPEHSFNDTLLKIIKTAAYDPATAIKVAAYRTDRSNKRFQPTDPQGPQNLIDTLKLAAYLRQQDNSPNLVSLFVSLNARTESSKNWNDAKSLKKQGVNVTHNLPQLGKKPVPKNHSKIFTITRSNNNGTKDVIAYLGSGNLKSSPYEDLGILLPPGPVANEIEYLISYLTGTFEDQYPDEYVQFTNNPEEFFQHLLVAPFNFNNRIIQIIKKEAKKGSKGHIRIKMNNFSHPKIKAALYSAAENGCLVQVIARVNRFSPKEGLNNLEIYSVTDHNNLLHGRMVIPGSSIPYVGSACIHHKKLDEDRMPRIEAAVPLPDRHKATAIETFDNLLRHPYIQRKGNDGEYYYVNQDTSINSGKQLITV
ncbi:MAG: hypothetical protein QNJ31_07395 [Candidatus Caenarcaniphilales bacterium]|nr:hypothetical protein [Candidatus Caenarcaniphilales bacterium]